jgi:hypothetical protein
MNGSYFSARHASVSALALAIGALLTASAPASVIHIWPGDSIQYAIGKSEDGDVIIVHPGEYYEGSIELLGKAITVRSEDPTDPLTVLTTVIEPPPHEPVFQCIDGEGPDTVISGFTLFGANMSADGGAMIIENSSPTVSYCDFDCNLCYGTGAAMRIVGGAPRIANCTFSYNWAEGYLAEVSAVYAESSDVRMTDCLFVRNTGVLCSAALLGESVAVTNCSFIGEFCSDEGVLAVQAHSSTVSGCQFIGNSGETMAGLWVSGENITVSDCTFLGNKAEDTAENRACALGVNSYGDATISDCTIVGNVAGYFRRTGCGGIRILGDGQTTITNSKVYGNRPDQIKGEYTDGGGNFISDMAPPPPPAPDPPDPVGACCLPGGLCMVGTEAHCVEAGGAYEGDDTDCETADCPEPCPGDVDNDGDVDTADLLALLGAWGACP